MDIEEILIDIENLIIELKYQHYCLQFSPAYLSGCIWYQYIQEHGDGSFIKAYTDSLLNDFLKSN